jgi:hypothetical protein
MAPIRIVYNTMCLVENAIMTLTAVLTPAPAAGYVALNPETGSTTEGEAVDHICRGSSLGSIEIYSGDVLWMISIAARSGEITPVGLPD